MSLLDSMPHTCMAKRRARTKDSMLGARDSYTTIFDDRECWRQQASNSEVMEAQARGMSISHKVFFVTDPDVDEQDILVIGEDTMTVRSSAHPDASAGMGVVWRVLVDLE